MVVFEVAVLVAKVGAVIASLVLESTSLAMHFQHQQSAGPREDTIVGIAIGQHGDQKAQDKTSMSGRLPGMLLFDNTGKRIGRHWPEETGHHSAAGSYRLRLVQHDGGLKGTMAEYVGLFKWDNDAICVQLVTVSWPSGETYTWTADTAMACGVADWHYSDIPTSDGSSNQSYPTTTPNYCVWLDKDHSNDIKHMGLGLHMRDFAMTKERATQFNEHPDSLCSSKARMHFYKILRWEDQLPFFMPPLKYKPKTLEDEDMSVLKSYEHLSHVFIDDPTYQPLYPFKKHQNGSMPSKRSVPFMNGTLIQSMHLGHSARQLCESALSRGPDLVSHHEKLFCDMTDRKLWPLCAYPLDFDCFDATVGTLRGGSKFRRRSGFENVAVPFKAYHTVNHWGNNTIGL